MKFKGGALLRAQSRSFALFLRKPLVFVITVLLIFGTFLSTFVFTPSIKKAHAAGTAYYVDATGGLDTNNGLSEGNAWKTLTKVNAKMTDVTIKAGDSVLFKKGETFAGFLGVTVTGTVGNILTFGAYGIGINPIISAAGNSRAVNLQSMNYITFQDLSLINGTNSGFYMTAGADHIVMERVSVTTSGNAFSLGTGTISNITISYATVSGGGRGVVASGFTILNNILIDNSTFDANTTNGIFIDASTGPGTASNITISHSSFTNCIAINSPGIKIVNVTGGFTITDTTISGNHQYGMSLTGCANVTMTGLTVNANLWYGIYIDDNGATKLSTNISISNTQITNNGSHAKENGISFGGAQNNSNATLTSVTADNNYGDGFNVHGAWQNIVCDACVAENNGTDGLGSDGDGFSWHDTSTGTIKNSIARNNKKSAIAQVNGASLDMHNNLFYHTTNGTWPLVNIGYIALQSSGNYNFYNNTIYSIAHTGTGLSVNAASGIINIKNNTIMGFDVGFAVVAGAPTTDYNDVYGATTNNYSGIAAGAHDIHLDPKLVNPTTDFSLQSTSPAIDAGIDVGLTTDYDGNPIYGAPDIGAYEYQPPEVIGTNEMDIGAGTRIYQDGSFRNLSTASGTGANLTITPQSGSFTVGNHVLWMDIVIVVWNNTGIYHKSWTETSTVDGLNNTVHKVGDLAPNKYYNVKVDNVLGANMTGSYCTAGLCLADNNGIITFTYTGGYSTHTFDVEGGPATVVTPAVKFPETGIPPSHNNIPRNIFTLSGLLALVSTSIIVVLRKRRKYSI